MGLPSRRSQVCSLVKSLCWILPYIFLFYIFLILYLPIYHFNAHLPHIFTLYKYWEQWSTVFASYTRILSVSGGQFSFNMVGDKADGY